MKKDSNTGILFKIIEVYTKEIDKSIKSGCFWKQSQGTTVYFIRLVVLILFFKAIFMYYFD